MKTKYLLFLLTTIAFAILFSCSKEEDTPNDDNNSNNINNDSPENILCDGIDLDSYFPLKVGFKWEYDPSSYGFSDYTIKVEKIITDNGKDYYFLNANNLTTVDYYYYFKDNGDLYQTDSYTSGYEVMYLPANPKVNDKWLINTYPTNKYKEITSLTATIETDHCTYTDCMLVEEYYEDDPVSFKYYYKKGIGLVYYKFVDWGSTEQLIDVTLEL